MNAPDSGLSAEQRDAVAAARAHPLSYGVQLLASSGAPARVLVVVGEAHLKLRRAAQIGQRLVGAFALRGVESLPRRRVAAGRALGILIDAPRVLVRLLSLGRIRRSTIGDALEATSGTTFRLESVSPIPLALHVGAIYLTAFFAVAFAALLLPLDARIPERVIDPLLRLAFLLQCHLPLLIPAWLLRRRRWSWLLHPAIAILTVRNTTMAEGTVAMLRDHPAPAAALVIMGRAHVSGYAGELVERHGFTRLPA